MLLHNAGRVIAEVASDVVSILNPSLIVIGGTLAKSGEILLSGIRELVYQRCLPLATRELQILLANPHKDGVDRRRHLLKQPIQAIGFGGCRRSAPRIGSIAAETAGKHRLPSGSRRR
ncbi:putative NBD/HSP70 family sugar kinase [Rhizobium beringeri]